MASAMSSHSAPRLGRLSPLSWPWQPRLLLLSAIWGGSFLFVKIGDRVFVPFEIAGARVAIAALFLLGVLLVSGDRLPRGVRLWSHLAVAGLLLNAVPFTLIAWGEVRVSAVTAGLLNAATPLFAVPVAFFMIPADRQGRPPLSGMLVGFVGVVVLLGAWSGSGGSHLSGELACLLSTVCYGFGLPYMRRFVTGSDASATSLAAAQLICATLEMALVAPVFVRVPSHLPLGETLSVVALGVLCTGYAYILNYANVRQAGATNSSFVTYLIPIFSTALGIIFLSERLHWYEPLGAVVVLIGVALTQGLLSRATTARLLSPMRAHRPRAIELEEPSQHLGKEGARPLVLRVGEHVPRVSAFDDDA
jgi:drug/metabolite transporter (DMT)-like permease